jgi:hypothetical protein
MKRGVYAFFGLAAITTSIFVAGLAGQAQANINVNINIGPPPVVITEPPELIMMPGLRIYFVPSYSFDIFYYDGYWWSPRGNSWYRSRSHSGPWGVIQRNYVPAPLFRVPRDYRSVYKKERPVRFGEWKKQRQSQIGYRHNEREKTGHGNGNGRGRGK